MCRNSKHHLHGNTNMDAEYWVTKIMIPPHGELWVQGVLFGGVGKSEVPTAVTKFLLEVAM